MMSTIMNDDDEVPTYLVLQSRTTTTECARVILSRGAAVIHISLITVLIHGPFIGGPLQWAASCAPLTMALRAKVWRYAVLLHLLLAVSSGLAADLCQLCDCEWHANGLDMDRIICQTRSRELFEEDLEWPKVARIGVIEFKDMTSSVLPV